MAARKQLTPAEVKAAKQKKIAIIGSILLVAILAFEVPKTMKMMSSKPPPASAAPAASATPEPTGATPVPADPAAAAAATGAAPASATGVDGMVVNADLTPTPLDGQLPALTATFTSKDPFRQQLQVGLASGPTDETTTPGPTKPITGIVPGGGNGTTTTTPTSAPPTSSTPSAPPVSAVISVNGVQEAVGVTSDFPASTPLFTLRSLTKTTAQIAIAGGSLSSGAPTITLKLNVPLTLMNTADGTRYKLLLVSTSSTAVTPTTSAPATTTTTTTTTTGG